MVDVGKAATQFLGAAISEARRAGLVPKVGRRGDDSPWPPSYAIRSIAEGPSSEALIAAMRAAYPKRFDRETKFPYRDPTQYAAALLRSVIAQSVVRRVVPSARSEIARAAIEEMERVILVDGQTYASLWAISDLDLTQVDGEPIGAVSLVARTNPPERAVGQRLPEALHVGERYPMPGSRHGGLLYSSVVVEGHPWLRTEAMNHGIGRVLTALRLATGMTGRPTMVWTGEPSLIHVEAPMALAQPADIMESSWRRVAFVRPDDIIGLRPLVAMLARLEPDGAKTLPAVVIAWRRFDRSFRPAPWQDTVLDLAMALEACLGAGTKEEIGLALRTRAAHLLAPEDSAEAAAIYDDVTDLYNLRSEIIHGAPRLRKSLERLWTERGLAPVLQSDGAHVLLDRWRDIIRRSIAARLLLDDLWPLRKDIAVDRVLVQRDGRQEWHAAIEAGAASYGLPILATAAPPLIDYLHAG